MPSPYSIAETIYTEDVTDPEEHGIRAHSIQNATVLDVLCTAGHVIMPKLELRAGAREVCFRPVGRSEATTFTGLCSKHDQLLFDPIDKQPVDFNSQEHLFLLAYRAVLREVHASCTGAMRVQAGYLAKVELGLAPRDAPSRELNTATAHLVNAYESYLYKRDYDSAYLTRHFSQISHVRLFEPPRRPTIAVSAPFFVDWIEVGDNVARIALNVSPFADGVMVVFSFLSQHAREIAPFLRAFQTPSGDRLLKRISAQVLNSCENFVLNPHFWNSLDQAAKEKIEQLYRSTIMRNAETLDDLDVMLFSPEQI